MRFSSVLVIALLVLATVLAAPPSTGGQDAAALTNSADAAFDTEEEFVDAYDTFNDALLESGPITEDDFVLSDELPIDFGFPKLSELLEKVFDLKTYKDDDIKRAIETKDAGLLNQLVTCPACSEYLDSMTLVTTDCLHELHEDCFSRNMYRCPLCNAPATLIENQPKTLSKALLELLEQEAVFPPPLADEPSSNPVTPAFSDANDADPLASLARIMEASKELFTYVEPIVRSIADVLSETAGVAKNGENLRLLELTMRNIRGGLAFPRAIWGVTVFDWSFSNITHEHLELGGDETRELYNAMLQEYAKPEILIAINAVETADINSNLKPKAVFNGAFHACARFLQMLSVVRDFAKKAFPQIVIAEVPALKRSLMCSARARVRTMAQSVTSCCSRMPTSPCAPGLDISANVVNWLRSLADSLRVVLNEVSESPLINQAPTEQIAYVFSMTLVLVDSTIKIWSKDIRDYVTKYFAFLESVDGSDRRDIIAYVYRILNW